MKKKCGLSSKAFAALLAAVLVIGCTIGGTTAWLVATSETVENTFTYGNVDVTLKENTGTSYKILPGNDITKDPEVTVKAGSVDCWLFVKITESNWPTFVEADGTRKVDYAIADGWTALDGVAGVYCRTVDAKDAGTAYAVLANNTVTVSQNLTKTDIDSITADPKLTFTAYAVQRDANIDSAAKAWKLVTS